MVTGIAAAVVALWITGLGNSRGPKGQEQQAQIR